jgi:FAD synthase
VTFIAWLRDEQNFGSAEELIHQMQEDSRQARAALARSGGAFPPI